ncbi:hypothetical protein [Tahibacter amnicola]|uniref:Secreted protein n=1 Tax=Tahibacter amnicola TaxID=2976241 RepID=A0ABY6BEB7_9GAMM|nr:hypothetical protein [Tahibacter amnicola]UXI68189.1 hypothetical protein N4264_00615 [Tahibacter amnicola]
MTIAQSLVMAVTSLLAAADVPTSSAGCLQTHETVLLETLKTSSCLVPADPAAKDDPPIAIAVRQTLTNVSSRPIEVQLNGHPAARFSIAVYAGSDHVSKLYAPREDSGETDGPLFTFHHLAPGESYEMTYRFTDHLTEAVREGPVYSVALNEGYVYRTMDEPQGKAYLTRKEERQRKQIAPETGWFWNVRLR